MNHKRLYAKSLINVFLFIALLFLPALADVKLPAVISDNMVLQQKMKTPIWGWANTGEKITVKTSWDSKTVSAKADKDGKWMVKIQTPKAGGPYEITIQASNTIVLKNVLIGEVWICSGQSNMQWTLINSKDGKEEVAAADYPNIRLFKVPMKFSPQPQNDCQGNWQECNPKTVFNFSGVGYYFGRRLHKQLNVPIGLIFTAYGGSTAESWTRMQVMESEPIFESILKKYKNVLKTHFDELEKYKQKMKQWNENQAKPADQRDKNLSQPVKPEGRELQRAPSGLYNAMLYPLIPFGIRGVIWYQGEANAHREGSFEYRKIFPVMIKNWRKDWQQGNFPFYFVQLPNFAYDANSSRDWPPMRESQFKTLSVPNTGMAVTIDVGDAKELHPKNKKDVGERLALWALAKTYGKYIVYSGPFYKSMKIRGNKIILSFNHIGSGLMIKDSDILKGFTIAGKDQKFVPADAYIEANKVIVASPDIAQPVAVRYAWSDNPECNLYNKEGLPASPFRTDQWCCLKADKK